MMNDGGPAFPTGQLMAGTVNGVNQVGMSLRDWFAGLALSGFLGHDGTVQSIDQVASGNDRGTSVEAARLAYEVADALLEVRKGPS